MFDYKVSKQRHFDETCRAFAHCHNMAKLAERAGMNVQTLRNKLNPEQPHQLTAPHIWLLTDLTEDSTLVNQAVRGGPVDAHIGHIVLLRQFFDSVSLRAELHPVPLQNPELAI